MVPLQDYTLRQRCVKLINEFEDHFIANMCKIHNFINYVDISATIH